MLPVTSCIEWAVVAVVGSAGRLLTFPWEEQYYHPGWASTIWPLSSPARPWHFFKVGEEKSSSSWGFTQPGVLPAKWVGVLASLLLVFLCLQSCFARLQCAPGRAGLRGGSSWIIVCVLVMVSSVHAENLNRRK